MKRSKGTLSTRTKRMRATEPLTVSRMVKSFELGAKVVINVTSYQKGVPGLRYNGRHGHVIERRGSSYVVQIVDGGQTKQVIAHPVHLTLTK